jgi:hypothetical protein
MAMSQIISSGLRTVGCLMLEPKDLKTLSLTVDLGTPVLSSITKIRSILDSLDCKVNIFTSVVFLLVSQSYDYLTYEEKAHKIT